MIKYYKTYFKRIFAKFILNVYITFKLSISFKYLILFFIVSQLFNKKIRVLRISTLLIIFVI